MPLSERESPGDWIGAMIPRIAGGMLAIFVLLTVTQVRSEGKPDFRLALGLYSKPVVHRIWSIVILREGNLITYELQNYKGRSFKRKLDSQRYERMLKRLNRLNIWNIEDRYPANSPNGYYQVEVMSGKYANKFRVEAGPVLSGSLSRYREIIRLIVNTVSLEMRD